jgi:hypothetical protein
MPLRNPRSGTSCGFHVLAATSDQGTLGDPEKIIWSSIRHLCSRGVAEYVAAHSHGIKGTPNLRAVASNLKLYVYQAAEFYEVAKAAKPNTAPLIYYYSFLNLAKALCEISHPKFRERPECYRHGISWRPHPKSLVNPARDKVSITTRGVWHVLWESLMRVRCTPPNPCRLLIKDLFLYCPEVSIEIDMAFLAKPELIPLVEPDILYDSAVQETWIRFGVSRSELRDRRLAAHSFVGTVATPRSGYSEIRSSDSNLMAFESTAAAKFQHVDDIHASLFGDILGMNVFCHLGRASKIEYLIPWQRRLPLRMPQVMVLYTILFWLGSLVRYDPHSVDALMESRYWILLDGFMSQSRLWLLEQFEWFLYQAETTLWTTR